MEQAIANQGLTIVSQFLSYGPVGLVALIYIADKMGWFSIHRSDTKKNLADIQENLGDMQSKLEELHEWHKAEDDNGVKKWYTPRSLESTIEKVGLVMDEQVKLIRELVYEVKNNSRDISNLREKVNG